MSHSDGVRIAKAENVHWHSEEKKVIFVPESSQRLSSQLTLVLITVITTSIVWGFLFWMLYPTGKTIAIQKNEGETKEYFRDVSQYSISSSGKIHNSQCRFFCRNWEPVNCKNCGGLNIK